MPEPAVTELGEQLYDALEPTFTQPDATLGWPLLSYCDALLAQAQGLRDQVKGGQPYAQLLSPVTCPPEGLPYLSQFAGVDLSKMRKAVTVLARNEVINPSFEYDAVKAAPYGYVGNFGEGVTETKLEVLGTWHSIGLQALLIAGKKDNNATLRGIGVQQKEGSQYYVPVAPGKFLAVQAKLNILTQPGKGFSIRIEWFKADGKTKVSEEEAKELLVGKGGEQLLNHVFKAPEKAAFARITIQGMTETALAKPEYWIDEIIATVATAEQALPLTYIDGDQTNCQWVGVPGQSDSIKVTVQSEEEFNELKRQRIKELQSSKRGTVESIVKAAQQYLIGDKTVLVRERPNGNAWRLAVVTFTAETISTILVKQAIEEFLPAGIILEYEAVPEPTWGLIRAEYETWEAVRTAFKTWGGVKTNIPGT